MPAPNENKIQLLHELLQSSEASLNAAKKILAELVGTPAPNGRVKEPPPRMEVDVEGGKIVEGIFDGQNMVGADGKAYSVPPNYASKSKLVEGDTLKLTIAQDGTFMYKQIGPVDRKRIIGKLTRDPATDDYVIQADGKNHKILRASLTYFKVKEGDEVVILVPQNAESTWAAVENVMAAGLPIGQAGVATD